MSLVRLIYASKFSAGTETNALAEIAEKAAAYNASQNISGFLVYGDRYFLQCLEGARESVNLLYNKITRDNRHCDLLLLSYSDINERIFDRWSMKFLMMTKVKTDLILKYSVTNRFDPYSLSGSSALKLLSSIAQGFASPQ